MIAIIVKSTANICKILDRSLYLYLFIPRCACLTVSCVCNLTCKLPSCCQLSTEKELTFLLEGGLNICTDPGFSQMGLSSLEFGACFAPEANSAKLVALVSITARPIVYLDI